MCNTLRNPANRPYIRRCQAAACLSLVGYLLLSQASLRFPVGPLHTTLAGLSGVCFFAELIAVALLAYRKFDEFQRILLVRSFLWATVITMGLTTIWGFAELGSHNTLPHFPLAMLVIVLIVLTAFTKVLIFRRNRPD